MVNVDSHLKTIHIDQQEMEGIQNIAFRVEKY